MNLIQNWALFKISVKPNYQENRVLASYRKWEFCYMLQNPILANQATLCYKRSLSNLGEEGAGKVGIVSDWKSAVTVYFFKPRTGRKLGWQNM